MYEREVEVIVFRVVEKRSDERGGVGEKVEVVTGKKRKTQEGGVIVLTL